MLRRAVFKTWVGGVMSFRSLLQVFLLVLATGSQAATLVEQFSPQGSVKGVRQVSARFSAPMVAFGDPQAASPFEMDCPAKGQGYWVDANHWAMDFGHDLPAGINCRFTLKPGLRALDGSPVEGGADFAFSTGGPSVLASIPEEGAEIDDQQAFILGLDAPASQAAITAHAWCVARGINEKIGVRLVEGEDRQRILNAVRDDLGGLLARLFEADDRAGVAAGYSPERDATFARGLQAYQQSIVVLRCARRFPAKAQVRLVWGKGMAAVGGQTTSEAQTLNFQVRENFEAKFSCTRLSKDGDCLPILPMRLYFTSPVPRSYLKDMVLKGGGKHWRAKAGDEGADEIYGASFDGPFPEGAQLTLSLPDKLRDDSGRPLANRKHFPMTVKTDYAPPLAKFPADFGIVELNAGATLPVTVRRLEPEMAVTRLKADGEIAGKALRAQGKAADILHWFQVVKANQDERWEYDQKTRTTRLVARPGDHSVIDGQQKLQVVRIPKPNGEQAFEVVGIPLAQPGFYVVELASPRLGAALLGEHRPYYARSMALVTNLSVHFKQGRESSLVWVTTLDKGRPVADAAVEVHDCTGASYWKGQTGKDGIARIARPLPALQKLPSCDQLGANYFVTARSGQDMSFVFSDWNQGIDRWRFNLPGGEDDGPLLASSVLDRSLLRAGETVHMKHFFRRHGSHGLMTPPLKSLPPRLVITHVGSEQRYELPLAWRADGTAESEWAIPRAAKNGEYRVSFEEQAGPDASGIQHPAGTFRVEAFRVPTLRASLKPLGAPFVNTGKLELDVQLNYLSGGGAGGLPVRLRGMTERFAAEYDDYPDFTFANGGVREGWQQASPVGDQPEGEDAAPAGLSANGPSANGPHALATQELALDASGGARVALDGLPRDDAPRQVTAELEFLDLNGEVQTASGRYTVWPSAVVLGIRTDGWLVSREHVRFTVVALDPAGRPLAGVPVTVEMLKKQDYSHRKRVLGGFYAYQNKTGISRLAEVCKGDTDVLGYVHCDVASPSDGDIILQARASDAAGNRSVAHKGVWVAGRDESWFEGGDDDRMDVLPEQRGYEPGDTASLQVRMPFREATALVTVEREGVLDAFVLPLSGKNPLVRLPVKPEYAPNVYVSVLAVRGRVDGVQPGALIDLGKPAFKLGIAQINVGWRAHQLNVSVQADREKYPVREKAHVRIKVARADGGALPSGAEVALAAVDEGLLELMPNASWNLLESMMGHRGIEVETATAQMQVIGKRHFGRKAVTHGGGGGHQTSRELFETLLKWQGRVTLDAQGEAELDVPLNDVLGSFRIVAIAHAGAGLFGTGATSLQTTQDVMLFSGLPPLVREHDSYRAAFTLRNASQRPLELQVSARLSASRGGSPVALRGELPTKTVTLAAGEAQELAWNVSAPLDADALHWEVAAQQRQGGAADSLKVSQQVIPALPVRTWQATLARLDQPFELTVQPPAHAVPGRGGVTLHLASRLADELDGVREYMRRYPYSCLEQRASKAVALRDAQAWQALADALPAYLDGDGLARYFPSMSQGSDTLTAYLLAIADEAGLALPDAAKEAMLAALREFAAGRIHRHSGVAASDLALRRIAALEALSRYGPVDETLAQSFAVQPNLWPTSAVLDWYALLKRSPGWAMRDARLAEAAQVIRARLDLHGTTLGFSSERSDYLWWLMASGDVNANRVLLAMLDNPAWQAELPRLARGSLGRQRQGHWNTTVANAWGVLAMEKFSQRFESVAVTGNTRAALPPGRRAVLDWAQQPQGGELALGWPQGSGVLRVAHEGAGSPWLTVQSRAAVALDHPLAIGLKIARTVTPLVQKTPGRWSRGDVLKVHLDLAAQSDAGWVVVDDPIPAGAVVLGNGLGRDSRMLADRAAAPEGLYPAFTERSFAGYRAYYPFVPSGSWSLEYTVRLNNAGTFELPASRVEAMYAPEVYGETPNAALVVGQ